MAASTLASVVRLRHDGGATSDQDSGSEQPVRTSD
jgi:hypothetical protein